MTVLPKKEIEISVPDRCIENACHADGYRIVCGTDEAGRGPLAGPVFAAACILPEDWEPQGLNDSKKLSAKKREALYDEIIAHAVSYGIASASVEEIDELNILAASQLAMRRAVAMLQPQPDMTLVDGNCARDFPMATMTVIGGDGKSVSIAAASILAKVTRDRLCAELDAQYPQYGIAKHKGYPTPEHKKAIFQYGPAPCHRKSFLNFYYHPEEKTKKRKTSAI